MSSFETTLAINCRVILAVHRWKDKWREEKKKQILFCPMLTDRFGELLMRDIMVIAKAISY